MVSVRGRKRPPPRKKGAARGAGTATGDSTEGTMPDAGQSALSRKLRTIPRLPEKGASIRLRRHLGDVLFVALFLIIIARFFGFFISVSTPFSVVASDSMEPTLERGDIVLWNPVRIEDVRLLDVIVYLSSSFEKRGLTIIHRVIEIDTTGPAPTLVTQGDNNPFPDQRGPIVDIEANVEQSNLLGRVLALGKQPFKVPFLGHFWLFIVENVLSGPIGPAVVPFGIALAAVFIAAATVTENKKLTRKERVLELILGREKIKWVVVFLTLLSLLSLVIGWPAITGKQQFAVSIGVGQPSDPEAAISVPYIEQFEFFHASLDVQNPGALSVRAFLVMSGEAAKFLTLQSDVADLVAPGNATIPVFIRVPSTTPKGVYNATITVYGSPHWYVLPSPAISGAGALWGEDAVYFIDFIVAFILTSLLIGSYFLVFRTMEYLEPGFYKRHLDRTRRPSELQIYLVGAWAAFSTRVRRFWLRISGWARDIDLVKVRLVEPVIAAIVTSPTIIIALNGQMLVAVFLAAPFAGLVSYIFWGARFRSQVMAAGLASAMLIVLVSISFPLASSELAARVGIAYWFTLMVQTIGLGLIIYALVAIPVAYLSYVVPWALHNYRESLDPSVRVREFSDF